MIEFSQPLYITAAIAILATAMVALARALSGPTVYDRILAVNMIGTKTVLLIVVIGYLTDRPEWEDIALLYALINFIGVIAVLKFIKFKDFGAARPGETAQDLQSDL